jgi:uncharacterized protein
MTLAATTKPIGAPPAAGIDQREADELAIERAEQHSVLRSAALHVLPGVLIALVFVAMIPLVRDAGLPPFMALIAADLVGMPLMLGALLFMGYRRHGRPTLDGVVLYRRPLSLRRWLWLTPTLLVIAAVSMALFAPLGDWVQETFFAWLPADFVLPMDLSAWVGPMLAPMLLLYFLVVAVGASIVEELYFRGYLLPRLSRFGPGAAVLNAALFALYHVWSPWLLVGRFVAWIPLALAARRTRSVRLMSTVHVVGNTADVVGWIPLVL